MPASLLRDFIDTCFHLDPALRPNAASLLSHPFLSGTADLLAAPSNSARATATSPPPNIPLHEASAATPGSASASLSAGAAGDEWPTWARAQKEAVLAEHAAVTSNANPFARDLEPSRPSALDVLRAGCSPEHMEARATELRDTRALAFVISCTGPDVYQHAHDDDADDEGEIPFSRMTPV